jgi:putative transposase
VAQLEQRRCAATVHFPKIRRGQLSQAQLARDLGVCRSAVNQWYAAWRAAGLRALRRRPHRGRPPKLTAAQWRALRGLLRRGARAAGFPTEQWTLRRIAQLIRRRFGVSYHHRYLERPLKAHGLTLQRPAVQARERSEVLVRAWLTRDWDAVKKRLAASGARLPSWTRQVTRFGPR